MCVDKDGNSCCLEESLNLHYLLKVMQRFGLSNSFCVIYNQGERFLGMSRQELLDRVRKSELLFNVMGYLSDSEVLDSSRRRVFLDIDPGYGQMWKALGLHDLFKNHHAFVTIGTNIGQPDCAIPTCGFDWITTPQPIVLDYWPPVLANGRGRYISSIATWRGPFGPIEYQGATYGQRVHEFRRFAGLPQKTSARFQLALDIHPSEKEDIKLLQSGGWLLTDPQIVAGDPWSYRSFIQESVAEFMVAKNMYVQTKSGWFSDRSICYLASGKPVLAQNTGIDRRYPSGKGLLLFDTLEEACDAVEEVSGNYAIHSQAARIIAEYYFDSNRVLSQLLGKLQVDMSETCLI